MEVPGRRRPPQDGEAISKPASQEATLAAPVEVPGPEQPPQGGEASSTPASEEATLEAPGKVPGPGQRPDVVSSPVTTPGGWSTQMWDHMEEELESGGEAVVSAQVNSSSQGEVRALTVEQEDLLHQDRNQWGTCPSVLDRIEQIRGEKITFDLCASADLHVCTRWSSDCLTALDKEVRPNDLVFVNPPFEPAGAARGLLDHIVQRAQKRQLLRQLVFLVPHYLLRQDMKVLAEFKEGERVFYRAGADDGHKGIRLSKSLSPVYLCEMAFNSSKMITSLIENIEEQPILAAIGTSHRKVRVYPRVKMRVGELELEALLDSGAGASLISKDLVPAVEAQLRRTLQRAPGLEFEMPDGRALPSESVLVPLTMPMVSETGGSVEVEHEVKLNVADLKSASLILGEDFLCAAQVGFSYLPDRVIVSIPGGRLEVKGETDSALHLLNLMSREKPGPASLRPPDRPKGWAKAKAIAPGEGEQLAMGIHLPRVPLAEDGQRKSAHATEDVQMTDEQAQRWDTLQEEYQDIFGELPGPRSQGPKVRIQLDPGARPVASGLIPMPQCAREEFQKIWESYIQRGLVEPSTAEWASPLLMVAKKGPNGELTGWRCVFDFRALNAQTKKYAFPLPSITELLQRLASGRVYSCVDLSDGFYHLTLEDDSKDLTTVITPLGLFRFCVMPMGLANGPAWFSQFVAQTFSTAQDFLAVYIDDVAVYSADVEEHLDHLARMFATCREHGLRLKKAKSQFLKQRVTFLGHEVHDGKLGMMEKHLVNLLGDSVPATMGELHSWLGLGNFYRRFCEDYGVVVKPLHTLLGTVTRSKDRLTWSAAEKTAFRQAQKLFSQRRQLWRFNPQCETRIMSDASSGFGCGAVLEQRAPTSEWGSEEGLSSPGEGAEGSVVNQAAGETGQGLDCGRSEEDIKFHEKISGSKMARDVHDKNWYPVEFFSKAWTPTQARYAVHEQELHGVLLALLNWEHLLIGTSFMVLTDNMAVTHYHRKSASLLSPREARWATTLSRFAPFKLFYVPGRENKVADFLSRDSAERNRKELRVLDLYAGSPSGLRALEAYIDRHPHLDYLDYQAVEREPAHRDLISSVHTQLRGKAGNPLTECPFRIGNQCAHNVTVLAQLTNAELAGEETAAALKEELAKFDVVLAGPPCQPFCSLNNSGQGLADPRSGFQALKQILPHLGPHCCWWIENVSMHRHPEDFQTLIKDFGTPCWHLCSGPQRRRRNLWSNHREWQGSQPKRLPAAPRHPLFHYTWQGCLDAAGEALGKRAAQVPVDDQGVPKEESPTLMCLPGTRSERDVDGQRAPAKVYDHERGVWRIHNAVERELLVGLQPGDSRGPGANSRTVTGNAIMAPCLLDILTYSALHNNENGPIVQESSRIQSSKVQVSLASLRLAESESESGSMDVTGARAAAARAEQELQDISKGGRIEFDGLDEMVAARHRLCGHPGVSRTTQLVLRDDQPPASEQDIKRIATAVIRDCDYCQRARDWRRPQERAKVLPWPRPLLPFSSVSIDECTGLPPGPAGEDAFLTITCHVTGYTVTRVCKTTSTAEELGQRCWEVFCEFGVPCKVYVDPGTRWTAGAIQEGNEEASRVSQCLQRLAHREGIAISLGVTGRHRTQGHVEVKHREVLRNLQASLKELARDTGGSEGSDWVQLLPQATLLVNLAPSEKYHNWSPAELMFGRTLTMRAGDQAVGGLEEAWPLMNNQRTEIFTQRAAAGLSRVDSRPETFSIAPGDEVLVDVRPESGKLPKLAEAWEGPYLVADLLGSHGVVIRDGRRTRSVDRARVKPYNRPADDRVEGHLSSGEEPGPEEALGSGRVSKRNRKAPVRYGHEASAVTSGAKGSKRRTKKAGEESARKWPIRHYLALTNLKGTLQVLVINNKGETWWTAAAEHREALHQYVQPKIASERGWTLWWVGGGSVPSLPSFRGSITPDVHQALVYFKHQGDPTPVKMKQIWRRLPKDRRRVYVAMEDGISKVNSGV